MPIEDNPYAAPASDDELRSGMIRVIGVRSGLRADLRKIAIYQKSVMFCLLAYCPLVIALTFAPPEYELLVAVPYLATTLAAIVSVFLLSIKIHRTGLGILLGLFVLLPCLGLFVLLLINAKATEILRLNGLKVGLFGANLSDI